MDTPKVVLLAVCSMLFSLGNMLGVVETARVDECMEVTEIPVNYEQYLPKERVFTTMKVPNNYNAYAFMWYTTITNKSSSQYFYRENATTDENGFRTYEDKYLIAVGHYYGKVGDVLRITMDTGLVYEAIIGDIKAIAHTDPTRRVSLDGSIVEFIVDKKVFDVSKLIPFRGAIINIEKEEL